MPTYQFHCRIHPTHFDPEWAGFFDNNGLTPEIYLNGREVRGANTNKMPKEMASWLCSRTMRPSVHAPFETHDPVLLDAVARSNIEALIAEAITVARDFNAKAIVCHSVFEKYRMGQKHSMWIEENLNFLDRFLVQSRKLDITLVVENVFDEEPQAILALLNEIASDRLLFCLDTGHFNRWSKVGLERWFKVLGRHLGEIHLHDNSGKHDEHLPPGEGTFPFGKLLKLLGPIEREIIITLEPLTKDTAVRALEGARRFFR